MGIHAPQRDFRRAITFGAVGLYSPGGQGVDQRLLIAAIKLLQGDVRDLPQQL